MRKQKLKLRENEDQYMYTYLKEQFYLIELDILSWRINKNRQNKLHFHPSLHMLKITKIFYLNTKECATRIQDKNKELDISIEYVRKN